MNAQDSSNKSKEASKAKVRLNPYNNGEKKKNSRRPISRPHETEEEAALRRFHDAQRMAKFRAKRKQQANDEAKQLEAAKLTEMAMISELKRRNVIFEIKNSNKNNANKNINNNNKNVIHNNKKKTDSINNHNGVIHNNSIDNNKHNDHHHNYNNNNSNLPANQSGESTAVKVKQAGSLTTVPTVLGPTKYTQLLRVIQVLGRDIKLAYIGSKSSTERIKMGIAQARLLVRDCLLETEIIARQ